MGRHFVRLHVGVQPHVHTELVELSLIPVEEVDDLRPPWLLSREPEISAETTRCFGESHDVAALRGNSGSLDPGRTATDDQYLFGSIRQLEAVATPFELASGGWVDQTADPVIPSSASPTHLVAGDAAADILRPSFHGFVGQMWVGDLASHDRHQVSRAFTEDRLGIVRCPDVALSRNYRILDDPFEDGGEIDAEFLGVDEGRHQRIKVEITARTTRDIVHKTELVVERDDLREFVAPQCDRIVRVIAHRKADNEIRSTGIPDSREDFPRNAGSILERTTPLVFPAIAPWSPELVDHAEIGGPDLNAIKTRFLATSCRLYKAVDRLPNF
jgi:hypothetical protein